MFYLSITFSFVAFLSNTFGIKLSLWSTKASQSEPYFHTDNWISRYRLEKQHPKWKGVSLYSSKTDGRWSRKLSRLGKFSVCRLEEIGLQRMDAVYTRSWWLAFFGEALLQHWKAMGWNNTITIILSTYNNSPILLY